MLKRASVTPRLVYVDLLLNELQALKVKNDQTNIKWTSSLQCLFTAHYTACEKYPEIIWSLFKSVVLNGSEDVGHAP